MYEVNATKYEPDLKPTCDFCSFPCLTCGRNATECVTCPTGYLFYDVESTCYEEINWYFPFLAAALFFFILVLIVDCVKKSTNFLHSILFFLAILENGTWAMMWYLYVIGRVDGDRSISAVSCGIFVLLNLIFIPVHKKLMLDQSPPEYRQIFIQFRISSWTI